MAALILLTALTVGAGTLAGLTAAPGRAPRPVAASEPAPSPTSPVAVAPAPAPAAAQVNPFLATTCQPAAMAAGSALGLGIPRPVRLAPATPERAVLDGAVGCLRAITGQPPVLRTQVPIDAARRIAGADDERAQLAAFAGLLQAEGSPGIISIRSHDFTRCGRKGAPAARQVSELPAAAPLRPCEYPTPGLYAQLLGEVHALTTQLAPTADLHWTAWNEPDHPMFTLLDGLGSAGAARRAGEYWARAVQLLGPDRVLAGEFSDRDAATLLRLRAAFVQGAGQEPQAWALHPYRDLTESQPGGSVDARFARAVSPAPVWMTEVTARLSGRGGIGGDAGAQLARGTWLRAELAARPVRAMLYLLTPPDAPRLAAGDTWDSAIADRQGRARPFMCGLAGLPPQDCAGDPATYGG